MVKRMRSGTDSDEEKPSKTLLLESTESMENVTDKSENKNVRSFYGSSKPPNLRWASPSFKTKNIKSPNKNIDEDGKLSTKKVTPIKKQQQKQNLKKKATPQQANDISELSTDANNKDEETEEKAFPAAPVVKRYYKRDIFWTSDVYGKKRKQEKTKQSKDTNIPSSSKVEIKDTNIPTVSPKVHSHRELIQPAQNVSIETQTSFSSSQDSSSIGTKSPVMSANSSPFVEGCLSETTASQQQLSQDENVLNTEDDEHYEMFNLGTSESYRNDSKSDSSCSVSPVKKTPKKPAQEKKTLLNYFSKLQQSDQKLTKSIAADKMKSPSPHSLKKKSQKQMQFSKTGLSPKVEVGFVIPVFSTIFTIPKTSFQNSIQILEL